VSHKLTTIKGITVRISSLVYIQTDSQGSS